MSLYHNKNITAYNIISKKNKQKTLGKTQNPLNTDPTAQSLLQKYNFVNNGQNCTKADIKFLLFCQIGLGSFTLIQKFRRDSLRKQMLVYKYSQSVVFGGPT